MLVAVTEEVAAAERAHRAFASVAAKLEHDRCAIAAVPAPPSVQLRDYRLRARAAIQELLPVAAMPDYHACLRALQEVRSQLPEGGTLRRNLDLFLDGAR